MITVQDYIENKFKEIPEARRKAFHKILKDRAERVTKRKDQTLIIGTGFPTFSSHYMAGVYVDNLVWETTKPGQIVMMYTPGDDRFHLKKYIIEKKKKNKITMNKETVGHRFIFHLRTPDGKDTTAMCTPNFVIPTEWKPKVEIMDVNANDLVCIKERKYRPGYDAKTIFKVIWTGQKYVRVVPLTSKYEIDNFGGYNPKGKKPGDGIFQYGVKGKEGNKGWKKNCYNMDIPKHVLVNPADLDYNAELLDLTKDLGLIGF